MTGRSYRPDAVPAPAVTVTLTVVWLPAGAYVLPLLGETVRPDGACTCQLTVPALWFARVPTASCTGADEPGATGSASGWPSTNDAGGLGAVLSPATAPSATSASLFTPAPPQVSAWPP